MITVRHEKCNWTKCRYVWRNTYSHHVVTLHIRFIFILTHVVELPEEIEGHHGIEVDHHSQQTHRHQQLNHSDHQDKHLHLEENFYKISVKFDVIWELYLFAIVSYRGQDGAQGFDAHSDVQQMTGVEKVVVVTKQWHDHIPNQIQERLRAKQKLNEWSLL